MKDHWNTRRVCKSRFQTIHGRPKFFMKFQVEAAVKKALTLLYWMKCLTKLHHQIQRKNIQKIIKSISATYCKFWTTPTWDLARDTIVVHRIKTHGKFTRLIFCFYVRSLFEIKEEMLNSLIYLDRNTCFIYLFYKSMLVKFDLLTIR